MLPALYRPAVYYLRVMCGIILLVPDVLSVMFLVCLMLYLSMFVLGGRVSQPVVGRGSLFC